MYLHVKGKAINLFYTLEGLYDSSGKVVGYELLTSIKYRNYNDYIDPQNYFHNVSRVDGIKILRSQLKTAINFINGYSENCFITINVNKNMIDFLLSDVSLLKILEQNKTKIILELDEKLNSDSFLKVKTLSEHCRLWLDDFGKCDYKTQLSLIPLISGIKISHQLLLTLHSLECGETVLNSIAEELRANCKNVIVEGVENKEIFNMIKRCNIDLYQGYYFGFQYLGIAD